MGSLAESLLAALADGNETLNSEIEGLRAATAERKRSMALQQRERMLKELGLAVGEQSASAFSEQAKAMGWEEDDLSDDEGLVCVICHEGYKYKPEEVLGVYVYNRRCSISQGPGGAAAGAHHSASPGGNALAAQSMATLQSSGGGAALSPSTPPRGSPSSSRADRFFASVCNMSLVHMSCHMQATRAERSLKVPRLEWDGASLRNQNTRCNNLLPIRGPQTPAHMYSEYAERYWANIGLLGRHEGSRFRMMVHDVRLLLQRLATASSFSVDAGGGSAHSNVKLLPCLVQMGFHCLGDTSTATWRQASSGLAKHITKSLHPQQHLPSPAAAASSPPAATSVQALDGPDYFAVSCLWFPAKWRAHKDALLRAMVAHALRAALIPTDSDRWYDADGGKVLEACRLPLTMMALLERLHRILHPSEPRAAAAAGDGGGGRGGEGGSSEASAWGAEADLVQKKMRNEQVALMEQCDALVEFFQGELAVSESLGELLDAGELLEVLSPPGDVDALLEAAAAALPGGGVSGRSL